MPGDNYYRDLCKVVRTNSKDRSRRVGSIVVGPDGEVRSTGYNGFPRGVNDDVDERHLRPAKYLWTEHSERNAIYQAARAGIPLAGCTMYSWAEGLDRQSQATDIGSCADCARAIIQAGIIRLVVQPTKVPAEQWGESVNVAYTLLAEAGVVVDFFEEE